MRSVTVHHAKTHLSRLLAEVEAGEEVEVRRGDLPVARLVPLREVRPPRPKVGVPTSPPVRCTDDAFAPLSPEEAAEWGLP